MVLVLKGNTSENHRLNFCDILVIVDNVRIDSFACGELTCPITHGSLPRRDTLELTQIIFGHGYAKKGYALYKSYI